MIFFLFLLVFSFPSAASSGVYDRVRTLTLELHYDQRIDHPSREWDKMLLVQSMQWIHQELKMGMDYVIMLYPTYMPSGYDCKKLNQKSEICLDLSLPRNHSTGRQRIGWARVHGSRQFPFPTDTIWRNIYRGGNVKLRPDKFDYRRDDIVECDIQLDQVLRHSLWMFSQVIRHEMLHCLGFDHYGEGIMRETPNSA
ncbi:MAG: hypothetical protein OXB86_05725, partial [Bdellovibrionales bacterium]|nr:hypothetical protein [Bdellovibrionales bacterium]